MFQTSVILILSRLETIDAELNRVLGGGIVPGSIVLVAGEPGIGKSTLFLQMGLQLKDVVTLYISGEESDEQIKMRAERLGIHSESFYLLTETSTQVIFQEIKKLKPRQGGLIISSSFTIMKYWCSKEQARTSGMGCINLC